MKDLLVAPAVDRLQDPNNTHLNLALCAHRFVDQNASNWSLLVKPGLSQLPVVYVIEYCHVGQLGWHYRYNGWYGQF